MSDKENSTSGRVHQQQQIPLPIPPVYQPPQQQHYVDYNRNQDNRNYDHRNQNYRNQDHRNQDHRNQHNRNYRHSPIRHHSTRRSAPIIISDSDGSDPVDLADEYDPGLPGYYYGGHGTCHRCGKFKEVTKGNQNSF